MNPGTFEATMRAGEWFHDLTVPPGMWPVIRVDGRAFTKLTTDAGYDKPFDAQFSSIMIEVARELLQQLGGLYAFTESDEVSVVLPPTTDLFSRSLEKLVSVSAGIATAAFTSRAPEPGHFDSRVWIGPTLGAVVDYLSWRQADAIRCGLNGWAYWTLRRHGQSARAATSTLRGLRADAKRQLLAEHGVDFDARPAWERHGIALWWDLYTKIGHDPVRGVAVATDRRRIHVARELTTGADYREIAAHVIGSSL